MKPVIIGTAGHIDHGKTALVRALTGVDADRLPDEKRRGITIDIGFADLDLGDVRVGFVDVPGHERFVKNMLAGAHGIDAVALVISADEGVMPQTREHFDICRLLDVRAGLVVLTKKDLVEDEMLELVRGEVRELIAGSFLAGAPVIAVSARTGEGIEELKIALKEIGGGVPSRGADLVTRLPIDRSFSMRGFGAVVTGTLTAGEINEGDELEILPAGILVRVRGVQVHGAPVKTAVAGQRTAVNLGGIESSTIERGMTLAEAGRLRPTQIIDAQVQQLKSAPRPLRSRQRVRVHLGAAEVLGRVHVLEPEEIKPGASGLIQVRFEAPLVAVLEDRFILRSYSPQATIGGGVILDALPTKHRSREVVTVQKQLKRLANGDKAASLAVFIENADRNGLRREDLAARTGWRAEVIQAALEQLLTAGLIVDANGILLNQTSLALMKSEVLAEVTAHHQREPLSRGVARETLRERHFANTSPEIFPFLILQMEKDGTLAPGTDVVRAKAHTRDLSETDSALRDKIERTYRDAGLAAPSTADALASAGVTASTRPHGRKILQLLIDAGLLVRVQGEMFFHRAALDDLTKKLREHAARAPERAIDVAGFKDLAGISRKYAIPLLEHFDRTRVTRREGDRRIIL